MRGSGHSKTALVAALVGAIAATATVALAGSGVGGIMNLGRNNTVDNAETRLTGANAAPMLDATNTSGSAAAIGVAGRAAGAGAAVAGRNASSGPGVRATSASGPGISGLSRSGPGGQFFSTSAAAVQAVSDGGLAGGPEAIRSEFGCG